MDPQFLIMAVGVLLATGAIAGVLAGMLGVGGGIVIVPVLFWFAPLIGLDPAIAMHCAVATSLASIVFTSISSARAHFRKGVVDMALLKSWAPWMIPGAALGGFTAKFLDGETLGWIFAGIAIIVALTMVQAKMLKVSDGLPKSRIGNGFLSFFIGGFSALMGIGGGTLSVPILSLFNMPIHNAVGTASSFGIAIAASAVGFYVWGGWDVAGLPAGSLGYVNVPGALLIAAVSIFTAPLGAKLAHAMPKLTLRRVFALFLFVTGARMVF